MEFLVGLVILVAVLGLAVWLFVTSQGDAHIAMLVDQRTDFELKEIRSDRASFTCKVPFVNNGPQDGTIMDAYTRHLMPMEYFNAAEVLSQMTIESSPRPDGYWESVIVHKSTGDAAIVTVTFRVEQGDIKEALHQMVDMPIDLVYQVVGRSDWYITKARITMNASEVFQALGMEQPAV